MSSRHGIWVAAPGEAGYPASLLALQERAPKRIYGLGDRDLIAGLGVDGTVTIVGARRASSAGTEMAGTLGCELASAGLVVVSGMAFGCDAAAHEGALRAGEPTIAVLAGGPDVPYPPSKHGLYRRILEAGAVISELEPGTRPMPWAFRARNRIMAALSRLTVVVEGGRHSGTRITSNEAIELGRDVAAVPGRVGAKLSTLPHELIRDGATLVRDSQDVLDMMLGVGEVSLRRVGPALEAELVRALEAVEDGATTCDAVALACDLDGSRAAVTIARLELLGYLTADPMGRVERSRLEAPSVKEPPA